ncbi:hypothetical protein RYX36_035323 [Vicia faba]
MEPVKSGSEFTVPDPVLLHTKIAAIRSAASDGLLQQDNPEYNAKRQHLYEHYHPLEFSPTLGLEEKRKLMEEWWGKTHSLLMEGGLTYESIKQSVANASIAFREGVSELFDFLEKQDIPVLYSLQGLLISLKRSEKFILFYVGKVTEQFLFTFLFDIDRASQSLFVTFYNNNRSYTANLPVKKKDPEAKLAPSEQENL